MIEEINQIKKRRKLKFLKLRVFFFQDDDSESKIFAGNQYVKGFLILKKPQSDKDSWFCLRTLISSLPLAFVQLCLPFV